MNTNHTRDKKHPDKSTHRRKTILDRFDEESRIIAATSKLLEHADDQEARFRIRDGAQLAIVRLGGA